MTTADDRTPLEAWALALAVAMFPEQAPARDEAAALGADWRDYFDWTVPVGPTRRPRLASDPDTDIAAVVRVVAQSDVTAAAALYNIPKADVEACLAWAAGREARGVPL